MFEGHYETFLLYFKLQARRDNHKMQQEKAKPLSRKQQLAQQTKREQVRIIYNHRSRYVKFLSDSKNCDYFLI